MNRISGLKPLLIFIVIAVVVAAFGFRWWHNRSSKDSRVVEKTIESADVKEFALGGDVVAVDKAKSEFTLKTGWVQKTDKGNQFVYMNRTILIYVTTKIYSVTKDSTLAVTNKKPVDSFRVGDKVTVYGSGNPITANTLLADKVEIQH